MSQALHARLNQVLGRLLEEDFLEGKGLGNELAFYIFEYPPEEELLVRERVTTLVPDIAKRRPNLKVRHVDLFDLIIDHLADRKLLEKAIQMQQAKGDAALRSALAGPLTGPKLATVFNEVVQPQSQDLVLLSGIGGAYPMLRSHSLLNNLQAVMRQVPLVMFFPGRYDGQSLRLFDRLNDGHYYRAFRLVP
ncbi:DUF1788 domain-containing protein [Armatimonas sp.]|uniref:DUF1788 domain-containing protein n=1 Tax=Armatimonas sp. TaxID=1872638 RepID=UPI003752892B